MSDALGYLLERECGIRPPAGFRSEMLVYMRSGGGFAVPTEVTIHRQYRPEEAAMEALVDLLEELLAGDAAAPPVQPGQRGNKPSSSPAVVENEVLPSAA